MKSSDHERKPSAPGRWRTIAALGTAVLMGTGASTAAPFLMLDLPDLNLVPDRAGQTFEIFGLNTGELPIPLNGVQLEIQVGDGGPEAGGTEDGPAIAALTVLAFSVVTPPPHRMVSVAVPLPPM